MIAVSQYRAPRRLFPPVAGLFFFCALILGRALPAQAIAADKTAAVILAYSAFGEEDEDFAAQMAELKAGGYRVLPLPRIVEALRARKPLPPKTVALTFDAPTAETLAAVGPLLEKYGFRATLFLDADGPWDEAKALKNVDIGIQAAATPESLNAAVARYRDAFGKAPRLLAWDGDAPQNERLITAYKLDAAFSRDAGVAQPAAARMALPRFESGADAGGIERFKLMAGALPLPVSDIVPDAPLPVDAPNPPAIGFTVTEEIKDLSRLSCIVSGQGEAQKTLLPENRVELRLSAPIEDHAAVNCTLPVPKEGAENQVQAWRWFGMTITLAQPQ